MDAGAGRDGMDGTTSRSLQEGRRGTRRDETSAMMAGDRPEGPAAMMTIDGAAATSAAQCGRTHAAAAGSGQGAGAATERERERESASPMDGWMDGCILCRWWSRVKCDLLRSPAGVCARLLPRAASPTRPSGSGHAPAAAAAAPACACARPPSLTRLLARSLARAAGRGPAARSAFS